MTSCDIAPGQELLTSYGAGPYAQKLGIITEEFFNKVFWYHGRRMASDEKSEKDLYYMNGRETLRQKELEELIRHQPTKII